MATRDFSILSTYLHCINNSSDRGGMLSRGGRGEIELVRPARFRQFLPRLRRDRRLLSVWNSLRWRTLPTNLCSKVILTHIFSVIYNLASRKLPSTEPTYARKSLILTLISHTCHLSADKLVAMAETRAKTRLSSPGQLPSVTTHQGFESRWTESRPSSTDPTSTGAM